MTFDFKFFVTIHFIDKLYFQTGKTIINTNLFRFFLLFQWRASSGKSKYRDVEDDVLADDDEEEVYHPRPGRSVARRDCVLFLCNIYFSDRIFFPEFSQKYLSILLLFIYAISIIMLLFIHTSLIYF